MQRLLISKALRFFAVLILVSAPMLSTAQADNSGQWYTVKYDPFNSTSRCNDYSLQEIGQSSSFDQEDTCYGDTLKHGSSDPNYDAWQIYQIIDQNTKAGRYSFSGSLTDNPSPSSFGTYVNAAYAAWDIDHPLESCPTFGGYSCSYNGSNYSISCNVVSDPEKDCAALKQAVANFNTAFEQDVKPDATDLDKYRYIQGYLCNRLYYNFNSIDGETNTGSLYNRIHNAYGALVGLYDDGSEVGHVVCQGYADAFLLLCQAEKLPCIAVVGEGKSPTGTFTGKMNHMWNYIRLGSAGLYKWYGIDATWDDNDNQSWYDGKSNYMSLHTYSFYHFGQNGDYSGDNTNHQADPSLGWNTGSSNYTLWQFEVPTLASISIDVKQWHPDNLTIDCTAYFPGAVNCALNYDPLIPEVDFSLSQNATVDKTCVVPSGRTFQILGNGYQISRQNGFTNTAFTVLAGGSFKLSGLMLTGGEATGPLICTASQGGSAKLSLDNTSITGNDGAFGVVSNSDIYLSGKCVVSGNKQADSAANILMQDGCTIRLISNLVSGSAIGITKATNGLCITTLNGTSITDISKNAFSADTTDSALQWEKSVCFNYEKLTTNANAPISVTYVPVVTSYLDGQTVSLKNNSDTEQNVTVYVALYNSTGKMMEIEAAGTATVPAKSETVVTLPHLYNGETAATAKLFVLAGSVPISQAPLFSSEA